MNETLIAYHQVDICQQELCVLEGVDLELHGGEFVYLIGKVGSGKTSLLKTFYAELDVHQGEAEVLGYDLRRIRQKHIPALRRRLGIVFQDFQLLTDRSVYANLEFVLKATGWTNRTEIAERIEEVLRLVGMENKGYKLPNELSGGEQQRVGLARALINNPSLIIADEPTGNVDPQMSYEIVDLLADINRRGTTVVMVTHEHQLARDFNRRVVMIEGGRVVADNAGDFVPASPTGAPATSEDEAPASRVDFAQEPKGGDPA